MTDEEIEKMVINRSRSSGTTKSEVAFYRNGIKDAIKRFGLRPSWKPSKEQMVALKLSFEEAFDDAGDCNRYRRLVSLYGQLSELM